MEILMMIGVAVAIGVMAQKGKGRTGIAWALLTFIVLQLLWFVMMPTDANLGKSEAVDQMLAKYDRATIGAYMALLVGLPMMLIVVSTLPKKQ